MDTRLAIVEVEREVERCVEYIYIYIQSEEQSSAGQLCFIVIALAAVRRDDGVEGKIETANSGMRDNNVYIYTRRLLSSRELCESFYCASELSGFFYFATEGRVLAVHGCSSNAVCIGFFESLTLFY